MASNKPHILVFIDWFTPGFRAGGPIRSVLNLTSALPVQFSVITSIYDHQSDTPYEGIKAGSWHHLNEQVRVMYLDQSGVSASLIKQVLRADTYDKVYLNSLFSLQFALRPLIYCRRRLGSERIILAPRGMLKGGALSVKSGKKTWFLRLAKAIRLFRGITWHATNEAEAEEIRAHFGNVAIKVAPNLPREARERDKRPLKQSNFLKLVTIARISREKGILEGARFLSGLAGEIEWNIYGIQQDTTYFNECEAIAQRINGQVHFHGEIQPDLIPAVLAEGHFFYLPTLGENFGHAIAESFLVGLPVIISDRTPWRNLEIEKSGWDLPLNESGFKHILSKCIQMEDTEYEQWCKGAINKGKQLTSNKDALEKNLRLFELA